MRVLKIKKNGKLLVVEKDGEKVNSYKVATLKENLACDVEFEKGLTFGTFLKLIFKEKEIFDIIFAEELNGKKLEYFEKKINEKPLTFEEDYRIEFVEVSKVFELFNFEKTNAIDLFAVFVGSGKTNDGFDVFIPISFYSIAELKDLEISMNKIVEVYGDVNLVDNDEDENEEKEGK